MRLAWSHRRHSFFVGWAIIITLLAFAGRVASLVRNARLKPKSTMQTAIGIKHPYIVQRSMGWPWVGLLIRASSFTARALRF